MSKQAADVPPVLFRLKAARPVNRCHVRGPSCALQCSRLHFAQGFALMLLTLILPAIRKGRKQAFDASEDWNSR
ncbi:hypothetical protein [Rhizobium sp. CCGE 510]|uniref:hypothetical protein n=1 Tax=Rhizobium sp. CCGE 510 TaxID=1132836 RepID=UPI0003061A1D|nr:hypothetical protein [Rhizobium sp. CCGE 510]